MTRERLEAVLPQTCSQGRWSRELCLDGIEDYLFIGGDRMSAAQAAGRLGVTRRTVERWRARIREAANAAVLEQEAAEFERAHPDLCDANLTEGANDVR